METEKEIVYQHPIELTKIQSRLKASKKQFNSFGKYHYRSTEDILEAVKPLCHELGCDIILSDEMNLIGDRYYVVSTATLINSDGVSVSTKAYAREPEEKKGMDCSQITGASSSYARKYALCGLFAIDDNQDADSQDQDEDSSKLNETISVEKELPKTQEVRNKWRKS